MYLIGAYLQICLQIYIFQLFLTLNLYFLGFFCSCIAPIYLYFSKRKMSGEVIYKNFFAMGTRLDMVLPDIPDDVATDFSMEAKNELIKMENKISIYKDDSVFSALNKLAFASPQVVEQGMFALIRDLKTISAKTFGYFDFTIGKLADWMRIYTNQGVAESAYDQLLSETGEHNVILNTASSAVSFATDKVYIDSGGFGKGLALDLLVKVMNTWMIPSAFVSFGESSILAHGKHPFGHTWKTGVRHLFKENDSAYTFNMRDEVLSVSGITPENIKKYGRGHVLNPKSGVPVNTYKQAAVVGPAGLISEALSTALLCAPEEACVDIMNGFKDYRAVIIDYDEEKNPNIVFTY